MTSQTRETKVRSRTPMRFFGSFFKKPRPKVLFLTHGAHRRGHRPCGPGRAGHHGHRRAGGRRAGPGRPLAPQPQHLEAAHVPLGSRSPFVWTGVAGREEGATRMETPRHARAWWRAREWGLRGAPGPATSQPQHTGPCFTWGPCAEGRTALGDTRVARPRGNTTPRPRQRRAAQDA